MADKSERGELARAVEKAMLDVPVSSMSDPELEAFERASSALADYRDAADAWAYMGRPQDRAAYDAARARLLAALSGQAARKGTENDQVPRNARPLDGPAVVAEPMTATDGDVNAALRRLQGEVDRLTKERDEAQRLAGTMSGLRDAGERDYDALKLALAASQAEAAKLREALNHLLREWMAWQPGLTGVARTRAERALSRAPGSDEALREVVERAVEYARDADVGGYDHTPEWIVARLVPDAGQKGAEG